MDWVQPTRWLICAQCQAARNQEKLADHMEFGIRPTNKIELICPVTLRLGTTKEESLLRNYGEIPPPSGTGPWVPANGA